MKEKNMLPDYLLANYFFYQFVNDFSALLLWKINIVDILTSQIFVKSQTR